VYWQGATTGLCLYLLRTISSWIQYLPEICVSSTARSGERSGVSTILRVPQRRCRNPQTLFLGSNFSAIRVRPSCRAVSLSLPWKMQGAVVSCCFVNTIAKGNDSRACEPSHHVPSEGVYLVYFSGPVRPTLGNDEFPARGYQGNVVEHGDCLSLPLSCRNAGSAYRDVVLPAAASGACMHAESERHAFWRLTETSFLVHFKSRGLRVRQWFALHCLQAVISRRSSARTGRNGWFTASCLLYGQAVGV
jgi:hypothetical protein